MPSQLIGLELSSYRRNSFLMLMSVAVLTIFSCDTGEYMTYVPPKGTVKDIDGNVYTTMRIAGKWWMLENLRVTKFNDGKPIPEVQSDSDWQKPGPAYCYYDNAIGQGLLYNFYVVNNSSMIAPAGWHIPTDDEWKQLEMFLGMSSYEVVKVNWRGTTEGDKLKVEAPNGWQSYKDVWGTNESGFTALAGGCRLFNGIFGSPGLNATGFWWTSTSHYNDGGWYRHLDYKNSNIFRYYGPKNYGFSIRCVKN